MHYRSPEDRVVDGVVWSAMIVFSISVIYPFWTMLVDSFSTPQGALSVGLNLWPRPVTLAAYREVFENNTVPVAYLNTVVRTAGGTAATLFVCFSSAYALSKKRLPFNRAVTLFMVFTMFFSGGLIATYLWMRELGLHNNRLALILPPSASAYFILIIRNFLRAIPADIEESAVMDGANVFTILARIVIPLSLPVVATIALWSAVFHWNAWFDALLYTPRREHVVLQLLLRRILIENQLSTLYDLTVDETDGTFVEVSIKAATLFVSIGPVVLLYPFVQRYFVKGVVTGAVKG